MKQQLSDMAIQYMNKDSKSNLIIRLWLYRLKDTRVFLNNFSFLSPYHSLILKRAPPTVGTVY